MQERERNELIATLASILSATREGRADWTEISATTFVWRNPIDGGRLIIQRSTEPRVIAGKAAQAVVYRLNVVEADAKEASFVVNSEELAEHRGIMQELFDAIQSQAAQKGISLLKRIAPR